MIALMTQAMRDPDPKVRMGAILYAPSIGEISSAAIPDVIEAARDPNASVRVSAIHSLGTWLQKHSNEDADRIVPVFLAALRDENFGVRLCAEKVISRARAAGIAIPDGEDSGVGGNEGPASP